MKLLIVEPEATGHHMALYARLLVRSALKRDWRLRLLTTERAIAHPAYSLVRSEAGGDLAVNVMDAVDRPSQFGSVSLLRFQRKYYKAVLRGFRGLKRAEWPDVVYMINFDFLDKVLAVQSTPFGPVPFAGMMMGINYHRREMGLGPASRNDRLYEWLFCRLLRMPQLKFAAVVDESFVAYAQESAREEYGKIRFVPDVGTVRGSESRDAARASLGIPSGSFIVLVYGSLSRRKGIEELLRSVNELDLEGVCVLLAGNQDEETQSLLRSPLARELAAKQRLIESPGFHDEEQEYRAFKAADVVWMGYVGWYGSSGVLHQAGSMGLPILATRDGLIGWLTNRHRVGLVVNPSEPQAVAGAIKSLMLDGSLRDHLGRNGRRLSADHSGEKFGDAICQSLRATVAVGHQG